MRKGWVVALAAVLAGPLSAAPSWTAQRAAAPTMDGDLAEACWQGAAAPPALAPPITGFVLLGANQPATQQTTARVAYDEQALYFAFDCQEDRPGDLVTAVSRRDGDVYTDDCVEVFLSPFADPAVYYHFVVNAKGVLQDEKGQDRRWDSHAQAAARRSDRGYTVELAVPLRDLDLDATVTSTWALSLCREERPHGEISSGAPMKDGFHDPARFGRLTGLDLDFAPFAGTTLASRAERSAERADCLGYSIRDHRHLPLGQRLSARLKGVLAVFAETGSRLKSQASMAQLRDLQPTLAAADAEL